MVSWTSRDEDTSPSALAAEARGRHLLKTSGMSFSNVDTERKGKGEA
jgi:hypothetical protein